MKKADALKTAAFLARSIDLHKRINNIIGVAEPKNGRIYYTEQAVAHIRELVARVDEQDALLLQAQIALEKVQHRATTVGYAKMACWNAVKHVLAAIKQHRERNQ